MPSGRLLWEWRSLDHVDITETVSDQLGSPFDYFHINGIEVDGDGNLARLCPQHLRAVQDRAPDGEGPLAARWQAERLLDGQGDAVRLPARRAPPRGRPDDQPVRQRAPCRRRAPTGVEGDRARGRPAAQAGDAEARDPAPAAALRVRHRQQPAAAEREPARHLGDHRLVHRVRRRRPRLPRRPLPATGPELPRLPVPVGREAEVPPAFKAYRQGAGAARFYASWNGSTELAAWRLETGSRGSGRFARAATIRSGGSRRRSRSRRGPATRPRSRSTRKARRSGARGRFVCTSRSAAVRAGSGGRRQAPVAVPPDVRVHARASARPPRRRAGRGPRRAGAAAAGRARARSRRSRRAGPPTRPRTRAARRPRPGGCARRRSAPRPRRRARRARGCAGRPAACACATARRSSGGASRRCAARPAARRRAARPPSASWPSRTPPDWWRHGRTELMPDEADAVGDVHRAGRLPDPLELRPRPREPRRERVRDVVVARNGDDRRRRGARRKRGRPLVLVAAPAVGQVAAGDDQLGPQALDQRGQRRARRRGPRGRRRAGRRRGESALARPTHPINSIA